MKNMKECVYECVCVRQDELQSVTLHARGGVEGGSVGGGGGVDVVACLPMSAWPQTDLETRAATHGPPR